MDAAQSTITTPTTSQPVESRLDQILRTHDVRCARCGYNLRGLDPKGRCPECGTRITRSVAPPLFEAVDPAWVRRLARAVTLVSVGMVVWLATAGALAIASVVFALMVQYRGFSTWNLPAQILISIASIGLGIGVILVAVGTLIASLPNEEMDRIRSVRIWRHGMLLAAIPWSATILVGGIAVLVLLAIEVGLRTFVFATDLYLLGVGLGALGVIAVFVGYVGELLNHAPDAGLARRCAARTRVLLACILLVLFGFFMANTLLIPLGKVAQALSWTLTIGAGAGAALVGVGLTLGIAAAGRRITKCAAPAATPAPVDPAVPTP